jgi:hypothetical protein
MKTTTQTQNQKSGLSNRSEQLSGEAAVHTPAPDTKPDNRLPIDMDTRRKNRCLPTQDVLHMLRTQAPDLFNIAQIVGNWIWIQFTDKQPRQITAQLAQLGFHWNGKRQAWQHPCGAFRKDASTTDPREKFSTYYAADAQTA